MRTRSEPSMMSARIVCLFCVFAFTSSVSAAADSTCYYPAGLEYRGTPCDADAEVSPCCGPGFICLSNGLCRPGPDIEQDYSAEFYRSGCTDSSFNSTDCPRVCIGENDKLDSGETLKGCGQNRYCCTTNGDCCSDESSVFELGAADIVTTVTLRGSKSTSTSQPVGSTTTTSRPGANDDNDDSNAVAIGVGVGIGVGGFLAIVLGVFLFLRHRRNKRNLPKKLEHTDPAELDGFEGTRGISDEDTATKYAYRVPNSELDGNPTAHVSKVPQELSPEPIYEIGTSTQPGEDFKKPDAYGNQPLGGDNKGVPVYRHEAP